MSTISVTELHDEASLPIVDVREPDEYGAGHVPGAVSLPLSSLGGRLDELPEGRFAVICEIGGRSARVVAALVPLGHDAVDVQGGTQEWVARGFALER